MDFRSRFCGLDLECKTLCYVNSKVCERTKVYRNIFNNCIISYMYFQNTCAMNCLEKYLKMTQRISERFREHQLLSADDPAMAMQGMAPK